MAAIATVIINGLSWICSTATCNLIDQYRNFNDDVDELRTELAGLTGRKQDIESQIDVADDGEQMEKPKVKQEVEVWLKEVQEIDDHVQEFLQKVQESKWYKRACLDRRVRRKIDKVKEMFKKGDFQSIVIERASAPGLIFQPEKLQGHTKDEIWEHLMDNEVGMIGVCEPGGVGKTAIMKHINDKLVRGGRFHKVIWVVVSYPLDVSELQNKIVDAMSKKETFDAMAPTLTENDRAVALTQIMVGKRFVLILDDVWDNFSLSEVGIPKPTRENGCKVVITSRSDEVCDCLDCDKIVPVQPLLPEESRNLFLDRVGRRFLDRVRHDVSDVERLEEILNSIVEECDGLPLVIVLIAGSLRGKYDIEDWETMLDALQQRVESVEGMEDKVFARLKLSYDCLKPSEFQQCFLYCSLFREDYEFSRQELTEGWIDEGLIDKSKGRQKAYEKGRNILNRLERNYLLEKIVNLRGADAFKMHDVVRDMAIKSIGPGVRYMVTAGRKLTAVPNEHEWAIDLNKVSLMANYITKIPHGLTPKCPTLSTLILSNNPLAKISESFFEDMSGLKVLDLSRTKIEALPFSISKLEHLCALRLRACNRLKCLPSLEKLVALKKLDLKWTGIEVVPQGMEMLVSLEYLDLFCPNLKEIPTGILSKLSSLQYLAATNDEGSTSVKMNIKEVARLRKLEVLECNFDDMQDFNSLLREFKNFQSFITYKLLVGTEMDHHVDVNDPKYKCKLIISKCDIGQECIVLPNNLQHLRIHKCKNIRSSLNQTALLANATELGLCIISNCEETEYVVELDSSSSSSCSLAVLDKLERLCLWGLPRLWALVRVEGVATPPRVFSNLKTLDVTGCSRMRKLLPLNLLQGLQNLEVIHVHNCEQMEEIIASSDLNASSSDKFTFTFPKLRELELWDLPQLKTICSAKGVMVCDSIESISMSDCPELKRIPVQLPLLDNGQPAPPPRLRQIYIFKNSKEWWESVVEWDHPNAKNVLQPFVKFIG